MVVNCLPLFDPPPAEDTPPALTTPPDSPDSPSPSSPSPRPSSPLTPPAGDKRRLKTKSITLPSLESRNGESRTEDSEASNLPRYRWTRFSSGYSQSHSVRSHDTPPVSSLVETTADSKTGNAEQLETGTDRDTAEGSLDVLTRASPLSGVENGTRAESESLNDSRCDGVQGEKNELTTGEGKAEVEEKGKEEEEEMDGGGGGEGQSRESTSSSPPEGRDMASDGDDLSDSDGQTLDINYVASPDQVDHRIKRSSGSVSFLTSLHGGYHRPAGKPDLSTTEQLSEKTVLVEERTSGVEGQQNTSTNPVGKGAEGGEGGGGEGGGGEGETEVVSGESLNDESPKVKENGTSGTDMTDGEGSEVKGSEVKAVEGGAVQQSAPLATPSSSGVGVAAATGDSSQEKPPLLNEYQLPLQSNSQPSAPPFTTPPLTAPPQPIAVPPQPPPPPTPLPPPPTTIEPHFVERSGWLTKLSHRKGRDGVKSVAGLT